MSTNHHPSGRTPLHTADNDHAHEVVDHSHHHHKHAVKGKPSVTLNVTSMVDILFNLLVYFIVTANFAMDEGALKAKLPPPPGAVSTTKAEDDLDGGTKRVLEVQSSQDGLSCGIIFNGRRVNDFAALRATLIANNKANGGKINPDIDPIMIQPGPKVRWQHVVNAFNQTVGAGYKKVGFGEVGAR